MSKRRGVRGGGFTLIELLVVVSIIALLISILLPSLGRAKELANRAYCGANLRGISQALVVYAQMNDGLYPATKEPTNGSNYVRPNDPGSPLAVGTATDIDSARQNCIVNRKGSPTACLWILVLSRPSYVSPKMLLCKSDRAVTTPASIVDSSGKFYEDVQDWTQISYSISHPWVGSTTPSIAPWWNGRGSNMSADIVVASDMAPKADSNIDPTGRTVKSTSNNHEFQGMNVVFGDNHVEFVKTPWVGSQNADNIFTLNVSGTQTGISTLGSLPAAASASSSPPDQILTPVRDATSNGM